MCFVWYSEQVLGNEKGLRKVLFCVLSEASAVVGIKSSAFWAVNAANGGLIPTFRDYISVPSSRVKPPNNVLTLEEVTDR
jgi:hypothetical protein